MGLGPAIQGNRAADMERLVELSDDTGVAQSDRPPS
jgi:hypothetical protein